MPTLDDQRFEAYLKQFRPVAPEPLPAPGSGPRGRRRVFLWAGAAAVAAVLVVSVALRIPTARIRVAETPGCRAAADRPLTMQSATALLAKERSFKVLVDDMAFCSKNMPIPAGKQSAVAVLGQEKIKL